MRKTHRCPSNTTSWRRRTCVCFARRALFQFQPPVGRAFHTFVNPPHACAHPPLSSRPQGDALSLVFFSQKQRPPARSKNVLCSPSLWLFFAGISMHTQSKLTKQPLSSRSLLDDDAALCARARCAQRRRRRPRAERGGARAHTESAHRAAWLSRLTVKERLDRLPEQEN